MCAETFTVKLNSGNCSLKCETQLPCLQQLYVCTWAWTYLNHYSDSRFLFFSFLLRINKNKNKKIPLVASFALGGVLWDLSKTKVLKSSEQNTIKALDKWCSKRHICGGHSLPSAGDWLIICKGTGAQSLRIAYDWHVIPLCCVCGQSCISDGHLDGECSHLNTLSSCEWRGLGLSPGTEREEFLVHMGLSHISMESAMQCMAGNQIEWRPWPAIDFRTAESLSGRKTREIKDPFLEDSPHHAISKCKNKTHMRVAKNKQPGTFVSCKPLCLPIVSESKTDSRRRHFHFNTAFKHPAYYQFNWNSKVVTC